MNPRPSLDRRVGSLAGPLLVIVVFSLSATAADPVPVMPDVVRRYAADRSSVEGVYDLPWSSTRFDRVERLERDWQARLKEVDFDALGRSGRVDYVLLRTRLDDGLADLALSRRRLDEMKELLPFRESIQELEVARWRVAPVDAEATAAKLSRIPDELKVLRERINQGRKEKPAEAVEKKTEASATKEVAPLKVSPALAFRAQQAVSELRGTLREWFGFYDGFTPEFSWWVKKPHEAADKAMEEYAKYLREEAAGQHGKDDDPLVGDPIGSEALRKALDGEMIVNTPEEIVAIGEREFAWCEARMREAAREMGLGDDWKAALARVKAAHVLPGKQGEFVAEAAREATRFVKDRDLITVPPLAEETWRLRMTSPDRQKVMPYAAYAGPSMLVAYASEAMKHEDKLMSMRGNNRHFTRIVTAHELIPGHHLQIFQADRHNTHRMRVFGTPFFTEGWALYWELRLWDLGYGKTPEDRVGMLFWRMHRCARIIVSLKYHLGRMTTAEMIDFLVDRVGHERFGATSEVRRYLQYPPLYQAAYMIGGLQLYALHKEVVGSGRMGEKAFHDAILGCGSIPIEMVRAELLDVPLARETKASWRFADALTPEVIAPESRADGR